MLDPVAERALDGPVPRGIGQDPNATLVPHDDGVVVVDLDLGHVDLRTRDQVVVVGDPPADVVLEHRQRAVDHPSRADRTDDA